jgi:hypothetical protein
MLPESIPHINLGATVLVIFIVCLTLVLLRGMARILTGTAILAVSGWVALKTWHLSPALSYDLFGKPSPVLEVALPVLTFVLSFWLLVKMLRFVLLPFESLQSDEKPKTSLFTGLIVAVIPTIILFLIAASLFHHFGTIEEIRAYAMPQAGKPSQFQRFVRNCKTSIDAILPEKILRKLDPMSDAAHVNAAKLVTKRSSQTPAPVIDPQTGKPYPRAIVVDDPELQTLAREGKFGSLLRHPLLKKTLNDPKVQALIKDLKL